VLLLGVGFVLIVGIYVLTAVLYGVYTTELFPTEVRLRANGLCNMLGRGCHGRLALHRPGAVQSNGVAGVLGLMIGLLVHPDRRRGDLGIETSRRGLEELEGSPRSPERQQTRSSLRRRPAVDLLQRAAHEGRPVAVGEAVGDAKRLHALFVGQQGDRSGPVGPPHAAVEAEGIEDPAERFPDVLVGNGSWLSVQAPEILTLMLSCGANRTRTQQEILILIATSPRR